MTKVGTGYGLIAAAALLAGCASLPHGKPVEDYGSLPGSGDSMARGRGLLDGNHYTDTHEGGMLLYSNEKDKNAVIQQNREHQPGRQSSASRGAQRQPSPAATAARSRPTSSSAPSAGRRAEYRQFQEFQQFKKFQKMPKNSSEYQRFRQWQDWKQYQRWKNSGGPGQ